MSRFLLCGLLAASLLLGLASAGRAVPGDLDSSFGTNGRVTTDFESRDDFGVGATMQPDKKIVVAGNSGVFGPFNIDFALARYNPDGSLDSTFGTDGRVRTDLGTTIDAASDVVVQPDGKLVAAGLSAFNFAVVRYNSDGSVDTSFGVGGVATADFGGSDQPNAVVLQPDGKIVVAGFTGDQFALARFNADGTLDATYGSGGKVTTDFGSFDLGFDAAATADNKVVVCGRSGDDFALARYTEQGILDPTFGTGGKVTTDLGGSDQAQGLTIDAEGRVVAVGPSSGDFGVARYKLDGTLDPSFGVGGLVKTDFSDGSSDTAFDVVVTDDGHIVAAGGSSPGPGSSNFALARYDSAGNLDAGFGTGGKVTTAFSTPTSNALDILAQPDGKVVAIGGTRDATISGSGDFALARYLAGASAITVAVDVKPDSADNVIPLQSNGVVPVAILSTASFSAGDVDPASVCFGDAEAPAQRACVARQPEGHLEDVDGDGRLDLLLQYDVARTGIDPGDTQACLTGKTRSGTAVEGCDSILTR
jgi:uncharacterized delta-60 repeat protein